jgi:hypothetical protein
MNDMTVSAGATGVVPAPAVARLVSPPETVPQYYGTMSLDPPKRER